MHLEGPEDGDLGCGCALVRAPTARRGCTSGTRGTICNSHCGDIDQRWDSEIFFAVRTLFGDRVQLIGKELSGAVLSILGVGGSIAGGVVGILEGVAGTGVDFQVDAFSERLH